MLTHASGLSYRPKPATWYLPSVEMPALRARACIVLLTGGRLFIFLRAPSLNARSDPPIIAACRVANINASVGAVPWAMHLW